MSTNNRHVTGEQEYKVHADDNFPQQQQTEELLPLKRLNSH